MFSLRSFLTIVCLLCALAVSLISRCKTTGLDSVDPHAEFESSTYEVARSFITALLKDRPSEYKSFALRKDSYTEKATGITQIFYRQLFKGIQVLNGDISVNVKDGAVISHDDTFYRGGVPNTSLIYEPDRHAELCDRVLEYISVYRQRFITTVQSTMSGLPPKNKVLEELNLRHRRLCEEVGAPYELAEMMRTAESKPDDVSDPSNALLQLMVAASPHGAVRVEILNNHDQIRENMICRLNIDFTGENYGSLAEFIDNVPDAVSPVKAKPVYFQLPDGDKTVLVQAWLFEVEMRDNWYEAVVSRHVPHRIFSVVNRVKEASALSEPTQRPPLLPPVAEYKQPAR